MKVLIILLVLGGILAVLGWKTSRFGYETADYTVIESDGAFEIREYPSLTLVSTRSKNSEADQDGAFMRLFRYISKDNENEQKIAMTTPVFMTTGEAGEMSFVVPDDVAKGGAPKPKSDRLTVKETTMGRVAVYRYSGSWKQELRTDARKKLATWVSGKGLSPRGEFFSAGYDPPFTPPFLKRNEALVRLAK